MNVLDFIHKKQQREKISMITCYDYSSARIVSDTNIDCVLVGDSVAMTMYGYADTLSANVEMISYHTQAVKRGIGNKFIISDLPFLSFRKNLSSSMTAVEKLFQAGAQAIKLENAQGNLKLIRHLVESGLPVMGHLGLAGQFIHALGGFKVQGKTEACAERIKADAIALQEAGCFAMVLECIPAQLAKEVTQLLSVPTIGIGAGPHTDGQVLVWQDLLGMNVDFKPKFVKAYLDGSTHIKNAINHYVCETQNEDFPKHEYCY